jgi:hypothetical protein
VALSLATVGGKITAAFINLIIGQVNLQGLTTVVPTSVAGTGVTVSTAGKVTFAASTTVSINGCFTSSYQNYRIILRVNSKSAAGGIQIALRSGGVDNGAASYDTQVLGGVTSTTTSAASVGQSVWLPYLLTTATAAFMEVEISGPAIAAVTQGTIRHHEYVVATGTASGISHSGIGHRFAAAFDGLTFIPTAGNITGTVTVYGYNG